MKKKKKIHSPRSFLETKSITNWQYNSLYCLLLEDIFTWEFNLKGLYCHRNILGGIVFAANISFLIIVGEWSFQNQIISENI